MSAAAQARFLLQTSNASWKSSTTALPINFAFPHSRSSLLIGASLFPHNQMIDMPRKLF
jgi:hypothetical protein